MKRFDDSFRRELSIRRLVRKSTHNARPSKVAGADYNQLSTAFFPNVNKVLTGAGTPQDAVSQVEKVAKRIVR